MNSQQTRSKSEMAASELLDQLIELKAILGSIPADERPFPPEYFWEEIPRLIQTCSSSLLLAEQEACVFPNGENREIRALLDELRDVYGNMESHGGFVMRPTPAIVAAFRKVIWGRWSHRTAEVDALASADSALPNDNGEKSSQQIWVKVDQVSDFDTSRTTLANWREKSAEGFRAEPTPGSEGEKDKRKIRYDYWVRKDCLERYLKSTVVKNYL